MTYTYTKFDYQSRNGKVLCSSIQVSYRNTGSGQELLPNMLQFFSALIYV
jgi:hypothetical protein